MPFYRGCFWAYSPCVVQTLDRTLTEFTISWPTPVHHWPKLANMDCVLTNICGLLSQIIGSEDTLGCCAYCASTLTFWLYSYRVHGRIVFQDTLLTESGDV
jgi:hypothetical protein